MPNAISKPLPPRPPPVKTNAASSACERKLVERRYAAKLCTMVIVIVVALSVHSLIERSIGGYITSPNWTPDRELFLRVLYPVVTIAMLWVLYAWRVK